MDTTINRRVELKLQKCGFVRVEAPNEELARAWAKIFSENYDARAEEGLVDGKPAWIVVIENLPPEAA